MSALRGRKYTMLLVIFLESLKISNVEASKGKKEEWGWINCYIFIHPENMSQITLLCSNGMAV